MLVDLENASIQASELTIGLDSSTDSVTCVLPVGDNNIGNVDIASALPIGSNKIGSVDIASALPIGDNNIGNVDIVSMPSVTLGGSIAVNAAISETDTGTPTVTVLKGKESDNTYHTIKSTRYGGLHTVISNQNFEFQTANLLPTIKGDATYGFVPANFRKFSAVTGTTGANQNNELYCDTGTGYGGYGAIQSFRSISYAQGFRGYTTFAAKFGVTDNVVEAGVGLIGIGDELSFGYDQNQVFGVWHRSNGKAEVQIFTVDTAASVGETIVLTINGVDYNIPITGASDAEFDAYEIADYLTTNAGTLFSAEQVGATVVVAFLDDNPKAGPSICHQPVLTDRGHW